MFAGVSLSALFPLACQHVLVMCFAPSRVSQRCPRVSCAPRVDACVSHCVAAISPTSVSLLATVLLRCRLLLFASCSGVRRSWLASVGPFVFASNVFARSAGRCMCFAVRGGIIAHQRWRGVMGSQSGVCAALVLLMCTGIGAFAYRRSTRPFFRLSFRIEFFHARWWILRLV